MARRVVTKFVSDLSGDELGQDGQTVKFGYLGVDYEIDLSPAEADEFGAAMSAYLQAARRVAGRTQSSTVKRGARRSDLNDIRAWADEQGFQVASRGRIPQSVVDAYDAARKQN